MGNQPSAQKEGGAGTAATAGATGTASTSSTSSSASAVVGTADGLPLPRQSRDSASSGTGTGTRDSIDRASAGGDREKDLKEPRRSRSRSAGAAPPPPATLTRLEPSSSSPSPSSVRPPDISTLALDTSGGGPPSSSSQPWDIPSISTKGVRIEDGRPYRNSARIVHGYGPKGMAPLVTSKEPPRRNVIPVIITWSGGGKQVYVTGSFNNWKQKVRLNRSDDDFTTILDLPPGTHHFKFVVDDEWRCSDDLPARPDDDGNLVNYLEVYDERGRNLGDGLDDVGDASPGTSPDSPQLLASTPTDQYSTTIPPYYLPAPPTDPPPLLPTQLEKVVLNNPPLQGTEADALGMPNHVALNHLYACSIRDGVMAVAGTTRYRRKFVTHILYKALGTPGEGGEASGGGGGASA